jgi:PAS domain S-box-containing protein
MKNKITSTSNERVMTADEFIVSKTDAAGKLTYCNRIFIEYSGYSEFELLGQQHNIVRHPDMPRSVFHLLWSTLKSGNEFFGYVKNMAKDGSYYWVFANVTPSYDDNNNIIGYYSVRRKPLQNIVDIIEPLYKEMLLVEENAGVKNAISVATQLLLDKLQGIDYDQFVLSL